MSYRVLLVGGGSGGHVYPLVAVADSLKEIAKQNNFPLELMVLGHGDFIKKAAQENDLKYQTISAGKMRRYASAMTFIDLLRLPVSLIQSLWYLFWYMPDAVFAKGGYASVAPAIAARVYFIPIYLHESDSVPGIANKFLGSLAKKVFVAFKSAQTIFGPKAVLVGNPVRKELFMANRETALQSFNFTADKKTILITGGSQGAQQINKIILDSLVLMTKEYQVIHQCGESQFKEVQTAVEIMAKEGQGQYDNFIKTNYKLYGFMSSSELAQAYAACDIVVSRAGANIFEIAALGKPAIVIPIENSANNHQNMNALQFSKFGAVVMQGSNLTTHVLLNQIKSLLEPETYAAVGAKIQSFATPDAADQIAQTILTRS